MQRVVEQSYHYTLIWMSDPGVKPLCTAGGLSSNARDCYMRRLVRRRADAVVLLVDARELPLRDPHRKHAIGLMVSARLEVHLEDLRDVDRSGRGVLAGPCWPVTDTSV